MELYDFTLKNQKTKWQLSRHVDQTILAGITTKQPTPTPFGGEMEPLQRLKTINNSIAKLRRRAEDMTQLNVFGNSQCNQNEMFGGSLPEIRARVNALLEEKQEIEEKL